MCNNHFSARESAKIEHRSTTQVLNLPSNLLFGTDMFTFDTRLRFTHTYKVVIVRKYTYNFKST